MKVLLFSDIHWSTYTSIVRQRGDVFSRRLELLIDSMNWVNDMAVKLNCDYMICAGDMMDKSTMSDEEITALREIKWNNLMCYFVVGNHESSVSTLQFKSVDAILTENHYIENVARTILVDEKNKVAIHVLPYVTESNRMPLELTNNISGFKNVIVSHNDISGIQYGCFLSKSGYSVDEIESKCDLFLNGHIHNNGWITKKILNLGSLTAHNFTNDSTEYKYGIWVLDTSDLSLTFYENPYSLNFYKFDIDNTSDLKKLDNLKNNAVISIKCKDSLKDDVLKTLGQLKNVLTYKIIYTKEISATSTSNEQVTLNSKDHLEQFKEYITQTLGLSEIVQQELLEVCK